MAGRPNLEALVKGNPKAAKSLDKIQRAKGIIESLQAQGIRTDAYDLRSPFSGGLQALPPADGSGRAKSVRQK